MSDITIGIDPGKKGGYCYNVDGKIILKKWSDPITAFELLEAVLTYGKMNGFHVKAWIEKVHASPIMGQSSAFKFGQNYGSWLSILEILKVKYKEVSPQVWQMPLEKPAELRGAPLKRWLKTQAINKFADTHGLTEKKITLDVCDALLIWEYGKDRR